MTHRILPIVLLLALVSCSDSDDPVRTQPGETGTLSGQLILVEGDVPLPDTEVTLFAPERQAAVGRSVSDADGRFEFTGLAPGEYIPVMHSMLYRPVLLAKPCWKVAAGEHVEVDLRLRRLRGGQTRDGTTIRGIVQDRETGEPIANARVEMNFFYGGEVTQVNWSEYKGWSTTLETTTNALGEYSLTPVPVFFNPEQGAYHIPDYRIVAEGYRSARVPRHLDPKTREQIILVTGLNPGADQGVIEGLVKGIDGLPMAGVPVSAEWRRTDNLVRELEPEPRIGNRILVPSGSAVTDENGHYEIHGLPAGFYNVLAGAFPDDGYVGLVAPSVEVAGFNDRARVDLWGFPVVTPTSPAEGDMLDASPEIIAWKAVPEAASYEVLLTRDLDGAELYLRRIPTAYMELPTGFATRSGTYAWEVLALDAEGFGIRKTDRPAVFHLRLPEPD